MIDSIRQVKQLEHALGGRRVIVSGVRGADSLGLAGIPFFGGSHSLTMHDGHGMSTATFEDLRASRPGLPHFQFGEGQVEDKWVAGLRNRIADGVAIVPYKAFAFHKRLGFGAHSWFLGLDPAVQNRFDDRSWIEARLVSAGVSTIPWRAPLHRLAFDEIGTPLVVRSNRSVGGSGFRLIRDEQELAALLDRGVAANFSYARFYPEAAHLSTLAVVDSEGQVSLHGISRQLVGLPSLTESPFQHCGNRFGSDAEIATDVAVELERGTRQVGRWMATEGYVGAYGADWLVWSGHAWLAEVNARFTGSVLGNDMLATQLGQNSIYVNHIAAFLGVPRPTELECGDFLATSGCTVVQVVSHERAPVVMTSPREIAEWSQVGRPRPGVSVEHGGTLSMLVSSKPPSHTHVLDDEMAKMASDVTEQFTANGAPS